MSSANRLTRRDFLWLLAASGSLLSFSGCCTFPRRLPRPDLTPPILVIDPHCHIFNAHDLDIYNYIEPRIERFPGLTRPVLYAATEVARAIALTAWEEMRWLDRWHAQRFEQLRTSSEAAEIARANDRFRVARIRLVETLEAQTLRARQSLLGSTEPEGVLREIWKARRLEDVARGGQPEGPSRSKREKIVIAHLREAIRQLRTSPPLIAFMEGFYYPRIVNARRLERTYSIVSLFTPAMMDTDSWFQHRDYQPLAPSTPLKDQIDLYERIAVLMSGTVLPFLAFDPRRQVEWKSGDPAQPKPPLELVEDIVGRGCFVGVKLYPPMGYRPANNAQRDASPDETWPAELGARLDAVLLCLFETCSDQGLSVMAHTNKSHASEKRHLCNGRPAKWRLALEKLAESEKCRELRVNLAHFGGMKNDSGWREEICRLIDGFPGVYADMGNFQEISCSRDRQAFARDLKSWKKAHRESPLLERVMYGSDFFMNAASLSYATYAEDWISFLQDQFHDEWRQLVGGNAATFLGIRAGEGQRARLDEWIEREKLTPPWIPLL